MKLNGIRLLVKDFDESFKFYSEKLGLKVTWGKIGGQYASFDIGIGPDSLAIFPSDFMAEAIGNSELSLPTDCREKTVITLFVEDVDKSYSELSSRGVQFINKPMDMPGWGSRVVHMRDNEGNLIELYATIPPEKWDKDLQEEMKEYE